MRGAKENVEDGTGQEQEMLDKFKEGHGDGAGQEKRTVSVTARRAWLHELSCPNKVSKKAPPASAVIAPCTTSQLIITWAKNCPD